MLLSCPGEQVIGACILSVVCCAACRAPPGACCVRSARGDPSGLRCLVAFALRRPLWRKEGGAVETSPQPAANLARSSGAATSVH